MSAITWVAFFVYWFVVNFVVLISWIILLNGILENRFRYTPSILLSFLIVVLTTAGFVGLYRVLPVPFEAAVYARFLSFVLGYAVARDVATWIPATWKFRQD